MPKLIPDSPQLRAQRDQKDARHLYPERQHICAFTTFFYEQSTEKDCKGTPWRSCNLELNEVDETL